MRHLRLYGRRCLLPSQHADNVDSGNEGKIHVESFATGLLAEQHSRWWNVAVTGRRWWMQLWFVAGNVDRIHTEIVDSAHRDSLTEQFAVTCR